MDYGWARLDSSSYRMHCNEKDTTGNILAVSNICSLHMHGSYNDCNSSAICGLSCSSWEVADSKSPSCIDALIEMRASAMSERERGYLEGTIATAAAMSSKKEEQEKNNSEKKVG